MIKKILFIGLILIAHVSFSQVSQSDSTIVEDTKTDSININVNIPVYSTNGADADADLGQQDVSSLLQSSRDVFAQFSIYHFNNARYRIRGFMPENLLTMINGVDVSNVETGAPEYNVWNGLTGLVQSSEYRLGNGASRYGFSGPAGYSNIDAKASAYRKGTRILFGSTNRTYGNRITVSHSTGMMQNGWALRISASGSNGNQVYIPGTYMRSTSFSMSLDKKINDKHLLSFTGLGGYTERGASSAEQLEAYDQAGSHYYNSLWGYQDGKVRNSSVSKTNRPTTMLSHIWTPNSTSKLSTTLFFNWGKSSQSALNWNNSPNPRPDYYKYLPSYYYNQGLTDQGDVLANSWQNDVNTRQINWDRLIAMNQANLYTIPGQPLNTTDTRARYIVEDRIQDIKRFGFNSVYNKRLDNLFISAGINANLSRNHHYKILNDLLGATYWLDYDQFAQNLGVTSSYQQNDVSNPDRKIYVGDKFGYDYNINVNKVQAWGQAEYSYKNFDFYGGLELSTTQVWRDGFIANGKFPTDSKGKSDVLSFTNYGAKAGVTYKINGRNFLVANGSFLTRPPEVNSMFISPSTRNDIPQGIKSEQVTSYELSYLAKYPGFKVRATYYNTAINNQTTLRTYWHDIYQTNINYILTGLNEIHQGVELGIEKTLFTAHAIQAVFGYGNYYYSGNATAQAWQNNNNTQLYSDRTVYIKNYKLGSTPQMVSALTYRYTGKKFWSASVTFNYFGNLYIDINPDRRTTEATSRYVTGDAQYQEVVNQQKLPNYYTINASASKSFRLVNGKYYLNFNASVNNLLNNKNIIVRGYEQLRWDIAELNKFQNKYQYMMGLTYNFTASLSF